MPLAADSSSTHTIPDQAIENLIPLWIVTIVFNVATAILAVPIIKQGMTTLGPAAVVALLFPVLGTGFLIFSSLRTARVFKFGESHLHLAVDRLHPGSDLSGTIHVDRPLPVGAPVQLRLLCIRRHRSTGQSTHTTQSILWQARARSDSVVATPTGTDVAVHFRIPDDAKPSTGFAQDEIIWRLQARCHTGIIGYFSRFQLPIVAVGDEPEQPMVSAEPRVERHLGVLDPRMHMREPGILFQPIGPAAIHIHLAAGRQKPIIPTLLGIILTTIGVGLILVPMDDLVRIFTISLGAFFLLIGGIFDYIAIYLWLVIQDLTIRRGLLVRRTSVPLFHRTQTFDVTDIAEITCKIDGESSSHGSSGKSTSSTTYGIQLKTVAGKLVWIANGIGSAAYAEFLAEQIIQVLGFSGSTPSLGRT